MAEDKTAEAVKEKASKDGHYVKDVMRIMKDGETVTLSTGVKVLLKPISPLILQDINSSERLQFPDPPEVEVEVTVGGEKRTRLERNANDPAYRRKVREISNARGTAALEAMILNLELVDGVPDDAEWMPRLKYMQKRGYVDLDEYDMEDEWDRKFVYKRYVAVGTPDIQLLTDALGITEERIAQAAESFRG